MSNEVIAIEQRVTSNAPEVFQASAAAATQYKDALAQTATVSQQAAQASTAQEAAAQEIGARVMSVAEIFRAAQADTTQYQQRLTAMFQRGEIDAEAFVEEMRAATAELRGLGQALGVLDPSGKEASAALTLTNSEARGLKFGAMEAVIGLQLLQVALGDQLPQGAREAEKGLTLVATGMMAGQMVIPGVGAAVGALVGGLLALGAAAATVDPEIAALNKELEALAKHDDAAAGLAKLTGATQYDAEMALQWAKTHKDAADQLSDLTHKAQDGVPVLQGIGDAIRTIGEVVGGTAKAINDAVPQIRAYTQAWGDFIQHEQMGIAGFNALVDALAHGKTIQEAWAANLAAQVDVLTNHAAATRAAAAAVHQLSEAEKEELVQGERSKEQKAINADIISDNQARFNALNSLAEAHTQLVAQTAQQELQINRSLNEELSSLSDQRTARELANTQEIARANQQETDAVASANRSMNEAIARSDQELRDSLAHAAQSLADKESDISRSLADKEADIEHQRATAYQSIDDQVAAQRQELADKLLEIARNENEQEAALAWNTHSQLQAAKTDNEKENILERAQFEAAQIREKAGDQRSDAQKRFDEEQQLAAQKKALADQDYAYRIALAEREAAERRADAERQYAEQVALDRQRYAEQVALEHQRNADAIADAQQRHTEELAQIAQRLAAEEKAIDQQEARARQRAKDQTDDLTARVKQQSDAINQRYDDENRRIDETAARNAAAHHELVALTKTSDAAYQSLMASMQAASGAANAGMAAGATTSVSGIESAAAAVGNFVSGVTSNIEIAGTSIENWATTVTSALGTIAEVAATSIGDVFKSLSDAMSNFHLPTISLPGRAGGGPVDAGQAYMVGEHGPELFIPSQGGQIVSNSQISNYHNGGNSVTIHIHDATDPKRVGEAVRKVLAQEVWR